MTKKDLKTGMIVENRGGERFVVIDGDLTSSSTWYSLDQMDADMSFPSGCCELLSMHIQIQKTLDNNSTNKD